MWFMNLIEKLGIQCQVGHPAEIPALMGLYQVQTRLRDLAGIHVVRCIRFAIHSVPEGSWTF